MAEVEEFVVENAQMAVDFPKFFEKISGGVVKFVRKTRYWGHYSEDDRPTHVVVDGEALCSIQYRYNRYSWEEVSSLGGGRWCLKCAAAMRSGRTKPKTRLEYW